MTEAVVEMHESHVYGMMELPPPRQQPRVSERQQFGIELEAIKNKNILTQDQLAAIAKLSRTGISNLLLGRGKGENIRLSHLFLLADALFCLLTVEGVPEWNNTTSIKEIFAQGGSLHLLEFPRKK